MKIQHFAAKSFCGSSKTRALKIKMGHMYFSDVLDLKMIFWGLINVCSVQFFWFVINRVAGQGAKLRLGKNLKISPTTHFKSNSILSKSLNRYQSLMFRPLPKKTHAKKNPLLRNCPPEVSIGLSSHTPCDPMRPPKYTFMDQRGNVLNLYTYI